MNQVEPAAPEGISPGPVTAWFAEHVPEAVGPLGFELIAGGHSNLTFAVRDSAGHRYVLRRPPLGQVLASAHDMGREHRLMTALGPTEVPVPNTRGLCTDVAVNGAPFYVMDFVDGIVVRDAAASSHLTEAARRRACESLVDTLALLHAVDVDTVGLSDLGRHEGYVERQLKRWNGQLTRSIEQLAEVGAGDFSFDTLVEAHDRLAARIPVQKGVSIVHGDYRLDNCMISSDGEVVAVLDWEICTLGDPLADVGMLMVYWVDPGEPSLLAAAGPLTQPGYLRRAALLDRYAAASGRDLSEIPYYTAFGYWKLACIAAGVYARYAGGAMGAGTDPATTAFFGEATIRSAEMALATLGTGPLDGVVPTPPAPTPPAPTPPAPTPIDPGDDR